MKPVTFRDVPYRSALYDDVLRLRTRVLREPLGLSYSQEYLDNEVNDAHYASFIDEALVGCFILADAGLQTIKLRQMVVAPEEQRSGIGGKMLAEVVRLAKARGAKHILVHAREDAVGFYRKHGYTAEGDMFIEVTIPHRRMTKRLS